MQAKQTENLCPHGQAALKFRKIVRRAFRELRRCGVTEVMAFNSATNVYRLHNPKMPERDAQMKVADWIE